MILNRTRMRPPLRGRGGGVDTTVRRLTVAVLVPGLLGLGACCGGQHVIIDWIDFVQLNGITYVAATGPASAGTSNPALGAQLATTTRKLADNETDPHHKSQDGEAAFLPAGTAIYSLRDYKTSFRVAVKGSNGVVIYEADTNPRASTGADLLDLTGKVDYITVRDSTGQEATIRDAAVLTRLVSLILQAPVDQSVQPPRNGAQDFVTIHFLDGTQTARAFWPSTGELSRGIRPGPEFTRAILGALPSPAA
jgi:hypothetical protein